ncbi:MAG: hypothetical protein FWG12_03930 [Holophagaceae bacterium]|nr:hypothetical protein [Holophagaceae bacterium]
MRRILLFILALPLAAQAWDLRLEVPFPKGQNLPKTLIAGTDQLISGDLDTGQGGIFSVNHRLLRFGPILRIEWGAEISRWSADGNIFIANSNRANSSLVQSGVGLGLNAQFWIPFTGISVEMGVIQRIQRYEFSSDSAESNGTIGRTWLRAGMRYRLPFVPIIHPYIAASYQQPINNSQPVNVDSVQDIVDCFKIQGKGQEFHRMWTFGAGITF